MTDRRWFRWFYRIPVGVRVAVISTAIGVLLGVGGVQLGTSMVAGNYMSPGSILVSADQQTLASTVSSSCTSGELEAQETDQTVTLRIRLSRDVMPVPGTCAMQTFTATLQAPLGSRRLVDGVTHAELPSFNGAGILRPAYLPPGFIHRYDTATFPSETVDDSRVGCIQLYTQNDSYDEAIWITQDIGGVWHPPAGVPETPIVVRGHSGTALAGEIQWTENGQLFTIRSVTYAYATLSRDELIAIAEGLH
jgi:hypothetical protein